MGVCGMMGKLCASWGKHSLKDETQIEDGKKKEGRNVCYEKKGNAEKGFSFSTGIEMVSLLCFNFNFNFKGFCLSVCLPICLSVCPSRQCSAVPYPASPSSAATTIFHPNSEK